MEKRFSTEEVLEIFMKFEGRMQGKDEWVQTGEIFEVFEICWYIFDECFLNPLNHVKVYLKMITKIYFSFFWYLLCILIGTCLQYIVVTFILENLCMYIAYFKYFLFHSSTIPLCSLQFCIPFSFKEAIFPFVSSIVYVITFPFFSPLLHLFLPLPFFKKNSPASLYLFFILLKAAGAKMEPFLIAVENVNQYNYYGEHNDSFSKQKEFPFEATILLVAIFLKEVNTSYCNALSYL